MAMPQAPAMLASGPKPDPAMYGQQMAYPDGTMYQPVSYADPAQNMHYTTVPAPSGVVDHHSYPTQGSFPNPSMQNSSQAASPPESAYTDYSQTDLADLLGSLKMSEAGTGKLL